MYIAIEGIDGAGKSTAMKAIADWLTQHYPEYVIETTREPGGCKAAEDIRMVLKTTPMEDGTRMYLFTAAREILLSSVVLPALEEGRMVVSDRCLATTFAYQCTSTELEDMFFNFHENIKRPDLTIILDLHAEVAEARLRVRDETPDEIEKTSMTVKEERRQRYLAWAKREIDCVVIDSSGAVDETYASVWAALDKHL